MTEPVAGVEHPGRETRGTSAADLLTAREAADLLRVHLNTVHRMILRGLFPAYKVNRDWRIRRADLDGYLDGVRYEPPGRPG